MINIYEINSIKHGTIWLVDKYGELLVAGATPIETIKSITLKFCKVENNSNIKEIAKMMHATFRGISIALIAYRWIRILDNGEVAWMTDREGKHKSFPFKSIEEMFIVSDIQGWPSPIWLDEAIDKVIKSF